MELLAVVLLAASWTRADPLADAYRAASGGALSWKQQRVAAVAEKSRRVREDRPAQSGAKRLSGTLSIEPGGSVVFEAAGGGLLQLRDGPVELVYGRPSLWSFFTGDRRIALEQGGRAAVFQTSASLFKSFGEFATAPGGPHGVALAGSHRDAVVDVVERRRERSCTYAGFCMNCGLKLGMNGEFEHTCGFGYSTTCTGDETILERVTLYRRVDVIRLLSDPGRHPLGEITSAPRPVETAETLKVVKSCG